MVGRARNGREIGWPAVKRGVSGPRAHRHRARSRRGRWTVHYGALFGSTDVRAERNSPAPAGGFESMETLKSGSRLSR